MKLSRAIIVAGILIGTGLMSIYLTSCDNRSSDGTIIFTRIPVNNFGSVQDDVVHHYPGAQIVALHPDKPQGSENILSAEFYSACSPGISYDAKRMLFLAQQNEGDTWQVWEMDLGKGTSTQITDFEESC